MQTELTITTKLLIGLVLLNAGCGVINGILVGHGHGVAWIAVAINLTAVFVCTMAALNEQRKGGF